ncbi:MAG: OmpH family outer membrane protein [Sphingorhabdus sp.]
MNTKSKFLSAALVAGIAMLPAAASAQVAGIATFDTTTAILNSKARVAAYTAIDTQYASYFTQIEQKAKEGNELQQQLYKQFDANADKKLDDAEMAKLNATNNPLKTQIQTKNTEIQQLQVPIVKARMFALEEIAKRFGQAQQEVITQRKITMVLTPDAFIYAPEAANVTPAITASLDRLVPSVSTTPAANWQPAQQTQELYQAVGQLIQIDAIRNAQAQAAAQRAAQPGAVTPPAPANPGTTPPPRPQPDSR